MQNVFHSVYPSMLCASSAARRRLSVHTASAFDIMAALPLCNCGDVQTAASAWRGETFEKICGPCGGSIKPVACCCGRGGDGRSASAHAQVEEAFAVCYRLC
jgi:hypothetical protein